MLRDAGKQDELLDLYGRRAEQARSKEDRAVAELAAGELSEKLGRPDQALVHYKKALESNPVEHRALRAVIAALSAQQSWTELSKILDTAARSKRGEQDVPLLVELGNLLWKQLGQVKEAEAIFRRVRKIDPGNHAMVDFYREYFTGRNEIPQLVSLLAQAQKMEGDVDRQVAMGIEMARAVEQREGRGRGQGREERREGDRHLEGPAAPAAAPARGGRVAEAALHAHREVERAARAAQGGSRDRRRPRTSTKRSIVSWTSSRSIETA